MIVFGEFFSRYCKGRLKIGFGAWMLLASGVMFVFAALVSGQSLTQSQSDWSQLTPPPATASDTNAFQVNFDASNAPAADLADLAAETNSDGTNTYKEDLAMASYYKKTSEPEKAEPILINLLADNVPDRVQKLALLQLGAVVRDENDLPRAQTIYAQFLNRWPDDARVPEVYLRQGEVFRQMGLTDLSLGKFYTVMASAISLKNDQQPYYQSLVLQTQVEIAETHYLMGHYVDAADFYSRLLQNPDPGLNRPQMQFRLIRSLTIIGHDSEAAGQAQDFLARFPDAEETPEVRYYFAQALKALGRDNEALQQVLLCLQQQKAETGNDPAVWLYWQQRVGNEIANQLYHEGDYVHALEIYVDLAQLDSSATWQIPVDYQTGLTYEKLEQPQKAADTYNQILAREAEVGTNATPGMKAIFEMAQWRANFLKWQQNAQTADQSLAATAAVLKPANSATNNVQ
jgi:tetratricopeptide (TPR) repeat protein